MTQFPFKTRIGRVLDLMSRHHRLRPIATPVRRAMRISYLYSATSPTLRAIAREATFPRVSIGLGVFTLIALTFIVLGQGKQLHKARIYADVQKISNLQQVRLDVKQYVLKRGHLPETLQQLESDNPNPRFLRDNHFYDPDTLVPIDYKAESSDEYSLCADFHFDSRRVVEEIPDIGVDDEIWHHDTPGYHCFRFAVAASSPN